MWYPIEEHHRLVINQRRIFYAYFVREHIELIYVTQFKEYFSIVKDVVLCLNWLVPHRKISQCNSKFNCRECNKKHHTSLCHVFTTSIVPSWEEPPPDQTLTTMTSMSLSVSYVHECSFTKNCYCRYFSLLIHALNGGQIPVTVLAYCTKIVAPIWNSILTYLNKFSHLIGSPSN